MQTELITNPKEARAWVKKAGERSPVLSEVELHVFRGAVLRVVHTKGQPLTYNVTRFGKRKKNIWEPYANWYTAYTLEKYRREGLARNLAIQVEKGAIAAGCVRIKALAGTLLGVCLHLSLGHELWGLTEKLEIAVDSPLVSNPGYAGRSPPNAVEGIETPWELRDVTVALGERQLRYEKTPRRLPRG